jgi:hypothetical protein
MIVLHVDPTTENTEEFNRHVSNGKHAFVLIYMEGCGPCNATRPEWKKLKNILEQKQKYKNRNDILVADIDQEILKDIKHLPFQPSGFPTMMYINKKDNLHENYEDSNVKEKNRSVDSFIEWIETKVPKSQLGGKPKKKRTRKWSLKYKRSINCKRPRGFSQRQFCKYGRKNKSLKR